MEEKAIKKDDVLQALEEEVRRHRGLAVMEKLPALREAYLHKAEALEEAVEIIRQSI